MAEIRKVSDAEVRGMLTGAVAEHGYTVELWIIWRDLDD